MISKNLNKNFLINLTLTLLIFLFDRFSKIYVINLDKKFFGSEIFSSKFLNISLIWNQGVAFGFFSTSSENLYDFLTIFIIIVMLFILYFLIKSKRLEQYALIFIFSGALGNVYDRIFYRAVPDFIDFHIGNFHWFIFNVADIFITVGVLFMIMLELTNIKK
tara:strand:+ start:1053 stop:1538 length:486 start_codon:yes stop_codon:yes gene_type:complete